MSTLVCGGAGYIGSHMAAYLIENNKDVIVLDNLEKGHKEAVDAAHTKFYLGDLRDKEILDRNYAIKIMNAVIAINHHLCLELQGITGATACTSCGHISAELETGMVRVNQFEPLGLPCQFSSTQSLVGVHQHIAADGLCGSVVVKEFKLRFTQVHNARNVAFVLIHQICNVDFVRFGTHVRHLAHAVQFFVGAVLCICH